MKDVVLGNKMRGFLYLALMLCVSGCLERGRPVIADRSPVLTTQQSSAQAGNKRSYVVRRGDTLYSIAWRFELDYKNLARANGIRAPYHIQPGQKLRIVSQLVAGQPSNQRPQRKPATAPKSIATAPPKPRQVNPRKPQPSGSWVWPVTVAPQVEFGRGSKGMDFQLTNRGGRAAVRAANNGVVVYAGNGLGGFERLLIVKHANDLLSAYSFNGEIRVREQQSVKAGSKIADIISAGKLKQRLHFELRKDGEPINPRSVLQ